MITEKEDSSLMSGLKIGVLYNSPVMPTRGEVVDYVADAEVEEEVGAVEEALKKLGLEHQRFPLAEDLESLITALKTYSPDVVFNLCEAAYGDSHLEMAVPSMLELLHIPYTGSPPLALGLCQNKGLTKDILKSQGIPTPDYQILSRIEDWQGRISYPLFVKPLSEDGSIGITKESFIRKNSELKKRVEYIVEQYKQPALVEKYIKGRELNVSIIGYRETRVLPISEITFGFSREPKIVDYSAKWFKETEEYKKTIPVCPAKLPSTIRTIIEAVAKHAYLALCCKDYARVDIRLKGRVPYVLEVNPNPDISPDGGFARSLKTASIPYEGFIQQTIQSTLKRKT